PPRDSVATQVYFRKENPYGYVGYSKYAGLSDILIDEGIIKKKGSRYYFKDKPIANGEDAFNKLMHEDDTLRSKLIKRSSINTISKTRAKLESLERNMFPVKLKNNTDEEG